MSAKTRKQQIEEMLAEDPNDGFLNYGLAMEHVGQGDDAAAAERFLLLMKVAPEYLGGYLQGGQALVRLQRLQEAKAVWQAGIRQARQAGDAHAAEEMTGMLESLQ